MKHGPQHAHGNLTSAIKTERDPTDLPQPHSIGLSLRKTVFSGSISSGESPIRSGR